MRSAARCTALGVATAAAVAAGILGSAPAHAADGNTKTTLYTLAGSGACAGQIDVGVGHYPGQATLFLGSTLYGVGSCSVDLTYTFTPRNGGPAKSFTRHIPGPGFFSTSKDVVSPGPADIYDVTVSTNAPHTGAQPMTIDIQRYQG
ncbi:hypothetical protein AAFP35_18260 [Gordonia sp. CPCC 206044]|uniref:hypothetical protein n=1 Tax=Gordonia sp. CPCC 206044 TaxID=3140793 RepID=UPI003AF3FCC0